MTSTMATEVRGTLDAAFNAVRDFHLTFNVFAPDTPTAQTHDLAFRRAQWIRSEVNELLEATHDEPDLTEQADAYLDILYFAIGGLVELGVNPSPLFDMVHGANMAKLWPDGAPRFREHDGKILKPDGWVAPDDMIRAEIERQARV